MAATTSERRRFAPYIGRYSNGVIQQSGPEIYRFPHRTFQEYLAARRLMADDDWPDGETELLARALRRIDAGPQWYEVLMLAVSQQVTVGKQVSPAALLAEELLTRRQMSSAEWARDAILAGEILAEIGRERLVGLGERRAMLWERATNMLIELLSQQQAIGQALLPLHERVRVGQALGLLGDPRIPISIDQWQAALANRSQHFGASAYLSHAQRTVDAYSLVCSPWHLSDRRLEPG